ncbi:hypothetical protein BpHYR1_053672 [Brachionus plicatilis]|uniref:Uncharacterized protein n=1 Tax=Brachionus plicatilis TaxID=10195 RepID=A0A3M7P7F4_BRAPC|nr:hypothetical protein BpHYR1_053672 [Brachionus plicatilis]RMZ95027.1 hypothetical protein BpHYR1_053672 [Brachionus plicatilis]RMZ95028.1 hypothetical protein BpHYR1_053672 [Brachionus plicatilis]
MDSDSDTEDFPDTILGSFISADFVDKYGIEFDFDKSNLKSIIEEVVVHDKLRFSCVCGGYFVKSNSRAKNTDIYLYSGSDYLATEQYLNSFLNEKYRNFDFHQLGTVAPQGIIAKKTVILPDGKQAIVYFSYINFPKSTNHRIQLLNTFDLEPCKIIYLYAKNMLLCSQWYLGGGSMISENHNPSLDFVENYKKKGFLFENNVFVPQRNRYIDINNP